MNIQIFGTKKSNDAKKAERFFSDRGIKYHFRDLSEKGLAKGELDNICRVISIEDLIDKDGKEYKKRGMEYMVFNPEEEILNDPLLLKMPIVRNGHLATIGYEPDTWKEWVKSTG